MTVQNSVLTHTSAVLALRTLKSINTESDALQKHLSTGLRISGATDSASNYAIAQGLRSELAAFDAVNQGLRAVIGLTKVSMAAATSVSNTLKDMRAKAVEGRNEGLTDQQRVIVAADFIGMRDQLDDMVVNQASFNGRNILQDGSSSVNVLINLQGDSYTIDNYEIQAINLQLGLPDANLDSVANATAAETYVVEAMGTVSDALAGLGASTRFLEQQISFNESLSDATAEGLGNIVDADLARDSARFNALKVRNELSIQVVNIANQRPNVLLDLLR
ncbi:flagellin [uncultured Nisaea sp.]|uniref:flagellin n=1 Tax=uncultured Nisaea sp. TaxID=538215 RepID=UPI0030EE6F8C|tara:strand:+ start:749 stop:1579 length:831 start_codon:yes stop_codon:yes gene_type:complete